MADDKYFFSSDPTSAGDQIASYVREYYEANRESWWDRHRPSADRNGSHADEWMLRFLGEIGQIYDAAEKARKKWEEQDKKELRVPEKLPGLKKSSTVNKSAVPKSKKFKTKRKVSEA